MGRKKLFSLIEIAVAMAVAAIGVAAIMALLPLAVKSTSDSVGDTLAADAANTVIAQLDRAAWEHFDWIQSLRTSKPGSDSKLGDYATAKLGANESYRIEPADGLQKGQFAFLFGVPGENADFAAEVICWREQDNNNQFKLSSLDSKTATPRQVSVANIKSTNGKPAFVRVYIEISWPLNKPYKKGSAYPRQSRTFVREFLDPTYYKELSN